MNETELVLFEKDEIKIENKIIIKLSKVCRRDCELSISVPDDLSIIILDSPGKKENLNSGGRYDQKGF